MNDNITEINKDTFWALIQEAKNACGQDKAAWAKYMIDRLVGLGPEQALMFHTYMYAYKHLAEKYGLWDAANIYTVDGVGCDGFIDFRSWLIVQGKEVYLAALADPDSLADVEPYPTHFLSACFMGRFSRRCTTAPTRSTTGRCRVMSTSSSMKLRQSICLVSRGNWQP